MRRLFWLAFGLGAGATGAVLASRWTRRQAQRVQPRAIAREAKGGLLDLSKLVAGSIEEGKRADLAVVDRNLFDASDATVADARVEHTIAAGRVVHSAG